MTPAGPLLLTSAFSPLTSYLLLLTSLLIDINRRSLGEGDAVGPVEGVEVHFAHADMEGDGRQGAQEFAMRTWLQQRQGQFVPPLQLSAPADLPDEVVAGAKAQPCFEDVAHAVAAVLPEVEPPRVLQLAPELHEALLGVVYRNHCKSILTILTNDYLDCAQRSTLR